MQSLDLDVLTQCEAWLAAGLRPWLCTIVRTTGSSPRPVGSMLSYCDGHVVGTLSGGCVEEDLLQQLAAGAVSAEAPTTLEYGVSAEENERLGLPCGGRLQLVIQSLTAVDSAWVRAAVLAIRERRTVARQLDLATGATELTSVERFEPLSFRSGQLIQSFGPKMRLLLVGAGQLAQILSGLALAMDFDVLVTDPRDEVLAQWQGPDIPLLHGLPDDIILAEATDKHSVIITLTHDPRIDDMALMEALETDAWYVGALGSERTTAARLKRLATLGISDDQLARLHAPVGLPIGSKTPWEIAIAILAELTQLRRTQLREQALAAIKPSH